MITISVLLASVLVAILFRYQLAPYQKISFTLILSGLISNLIDRIAYGGVVDYIQALSLPRFNLADIIILIGIAMMIVSVLYGTRPRPK